MMVKNDKHKTAAGWVREKKAVLFDLFHTLTALEIADKDGKGTHEILGVSREAWNEQFWKDTRERLVGEIKDPLVIMRKIARAIDPAISDETIQKAADHRMRRFAISLSNPPQASLETLKKLKAMGKKIALVSNADVAEVAAWDQSPLKSIFDEVVISCHVGFAKPERGIYEYALRVLGVSAEEALFVGDGGSEELRGAREVGLGTVLMAGIVREFAPERIEGRLAYADCVIERIEELVGLL